MQKETNTSLHNTLSRIRICIFWFSIRVWLSSLSVYRIIGIETVVWFEPFLINAWDFLRVAECNQHFVAPATCHIPLWAAGLVTPFVTPATCHIPLWATRLDTRFVAPALYHMPIGVVSVWVREHPHEERTPPGEVFWTGSDSDAADIVKQNERMKEFEGGRRPTEGRSEIKGAIIRQTT